MNYQELFEKKYERLNQEQKHAVDTIDGPVLVIAGPGSGKTELLSLRIANILKNTDTPPSSILCMTFTESAALTMKKRLANLIGPEAYKISIFTFHGFGTEIINQNPEYFFNGATYNPADELTRIEILEKIFQDLDHKNPLKSFHPHQGFTYLKSTEKCIQDLKKNGLSPEEFRQTILENKNFLEKVNPLIKAFFADRVSKKMIDVLPKLISEIKEIQEKSSLQNYLIKSLQEIDLSSTKELTIWKNSHSTNNKNKEKSLKDFENLEKHLALADVYETYQEALHQQSYFDFDDMILETVRALEENPDLKLNIQEKYQYVLVDEFQDTSGVQMRLLENLLDADVHEGRPNILAVGDDDQSIYKFQGANIDNILNFHKKYLEPKIIVLTKNYRSTQKILDLIRGIILSGEERLENHLEEISKELISANLELKEGEILSEEFETQYEQYLWIAEKVKEKLANKSNPNGIAIIGRTHKTLEEMAKVLDFFDIPVSYERKKNLLEQPHIKEIIQILKFINSLNNINEKDADQFLPEILGFDFLEIDRLEIWKISLETYKERKRWLEVMLEHQDEKIHSFAEFLINLASEAKTKTAEELIDFITGAKELNNYKSNYKDHLLKDNYLDQLSSLQSFMSSVRNYKNMKPLTIKDFVNFIELHEKLQIPLILKDQFNSNENSISLLTSHGAKGAEFENVFILDCIDFEWVQKSRGDQLSFPKNLPLSAEKDSIEDKLRLFYVALSRAKRNLYLCSYKYSDNGREQVKLRFLDTANMASSSEALPSKNLEKILELKWKTDAHQVINENEKAALKTLLKDYKLNVTHFNNFLNVIDGGPQKFLEENLLKFPQMQTVPLAYGSAMHLALQSFHNKHKLEKILPEQNYLLEQYEKFLYKKRLNEKDFQEQLSKGQENLEIFFNNNKDKFDFNDKIEFNFDSQNAAFQGCELTGKIDKMSFNENEIIVSDYKTGKHLDDWQGRSESQKLKIWKYKNQLIFYKLLIENSRDFSKYNIDQSNLIFLEHDDEQNKTLDYHFPAEDMILIKNLIPIVHKKITTLDFPDISKYPKTLRGLHDFIKNLLEES
jgi:DNA helicase II / ATP-dependent DNA helicase PcrA